MKDRFDILLENPNTKVMIITESVDSLWEQKINLTPKYKRKRAEIAFPAMSEVAEKLRDGYNYGEGEMRGTAYWEYMKGYHKSWMQSPLHEKAYIRLLYKFHDFMNLFFDIQKNGVKNPLDIIIEGNTRTLYRGARRLVILKTLNQKFVKVRNAIVNHSASP